MVFGLSPTSLQRNIRTGRGDKDSAERGGQQVESSTGTVGALAAAELVGVAGNNASGTYTDSYRSGGKGIMSWAHDNSIASIRIVSERDKSDLIPSYTRFILESVQEAHSERQQIVETFGDFYVFLYGERPPIYNFGGTLINSKNANWVSDFMLMYERWLRGTRCAEMKARALLTYGGRQVEGYIINTSNQTAASSQEGVPFSFQLIVTSRKILGVSQELLSDSSIQADPALVALVDKLGRPGAAGSSDPDNSSARNDAAGALAGNFNPTSFTSSIV